jgi:hypothetical protein
VGAVCVAAFGDGRPVVRGGLVEACDDAADPACDIGRTDLAFVVELGGVEAQEPDGSESGSEAGAGVFEGGGVLVALLLGCA